MNKECDCVEDCRCEHFENEGFFAPEKHQKCGCPEGCECRVYSCVCRKKKLQKNRKLK